MIALATLLLLSGPKDGRWTLADGTKVSFIMVRPKDRAAWRPDGTPVDLATVPTNPKIGVWDNVKDENPNVTVVIRQSKMERDAPTVRFKLPSTAMIDAAYAISTKGKFWVSGIGVGRQPARQDVAVGIGDGPWKTVGWVSYRGGKQLKSAGVAFSPDLTGPSLGNSTDGNFLRITVARRDSVRDTAYRVVALNKKGEEMPPSGFVWTPKRPGYETFFYAKNGSDLGMVRYQERPCEWTVITAAYFKPASESSSPAKLQH